MRLRPPLILAAAFAVVLAAVPAVAAAKPGDVKVMTRNIYLGADLTPGVRAQNLQELVNAAGVILNEVDRNNFPVRMKGIAAEIRQKDPDLVGLQEVALWRTGPCTQSPLPPAATQVHVDSLRLLLRELNRGGTRYRAVVVQPAFDFEVYTNTDGDENTSAPGCPFGSEINGRLTMRDVILARRGRVRTRNAKGGTFKTLFQARPGGVPFDVARGWTRVDATVKGAPSFRFVNTHLEAFDNQPANPTNTGGEVGNGQIRAAQAKELVRRGGPASGRLPVILVGDLNSDRATEVRPGDATAYNNIRRARFVNRDTSRPLSCCLETSLLEISGGGQRSHFDHKVDHIMTNASRKIRRVNSSVTGLRPMNGYWNSDHAGIFSTLRVR